MISTPSDPRPPTRRSVLAATTAAALVTAGCAAETRRPEAETTEDHASGTTSGTRATQARQRGVSDPQPRYAVVAAHDLASGLRGSDGTTALRRLLDRWTALSLPDGTTRTVALGPALYRKLSLAAPDRLHDIPALSRDRLDPDRGGGDVLVQLCGDDPEALRALSRRLGTTAAGTLVSRWHERGSLPDRPRDETPRNLFGFKDGTENPSAAEADQWVWNADGSTYLVYRRIHMDVSDFEALPRGRQEAVIGRYRASGAPLGAQRERDQANLYAKTAQGRYVIPVDAHVRLAHSRLDGGARMLRRGYSYDNGADDRGLLFLAYMRDPALFTRVQERLDLSDAMNKFVEHRASAVGYVLPAGDSASLLGG
ncbi:Dyp-type peroxidase [Streptomyces shenzhenensis]|uniref:Dyp-type peroxidase n=1 Tax=Streptomyces shenzhenensis TaxID=943815 RepID=UPI0033F14F68